MPVKKEVFYLGIPFRISVYTDGHGKPRRHVYLLTPDAQKSFAQAPSFRCTDDAAPQKIKQIQQELLLQNRDAITAWLKANALPDVPLALYVFLEQDRIHNSLGLSRAAERRFKLLIHFVNISKIQLFSFLRDYNFSNSLIKKIFSTKENQKDIWIALEQVSRLLCKDNIFNENPFSGKSLYFTRSKAEQAAKNIMPKHVDIIYFQCFVNNCLDKVASEPLYGATLLHTLTGLTIYELCGLNIESFQAQNCTYSLKIDHIFYQKRYKTPKMTSLLEEESQYRYLPLTPLCASLLCEICASRLSAGATLESPLFIEISGKRLTPEHLKKFVNPLYKNLFHIENPSTRTNFVRENFSYYARRICGFTEAQVDVLLGRTPQRTFEQYYPDYNNPGVCFHLAAQLDRWHRQLLFPATVHGSPTLMLFLSAKSDLTMHIQAPYGVTATFDYAPTP